MKKTLLISLLAFVTIILVSRQGYAQNQMADSTGLYQVRTIDGNEFIGIIVSQNAEVVVIKTLDLGEISIRKQTISQIRRVKKEEMVNGELWPENPHSTRYFFNSNGYGLRKGEGYYSNTWLYFNQVSYGFSDNFTMGIGIVPLFVIFPVWVTPKVSIPVQKDKVNVGIGGLFGGVFNTFNDGGGDNLGFGIAYGQLTLGSRDKNINFGLGYGYAGGEWASKPTLNVSGMVRVSKKFAFMTENYFINAGGSNATIISFGGRFIGRKVGIDVAVAGGGITDEGAFAIPWFSVTVPFGKTAAKEGKAPKSTKKK